MSKIAVRPGLMYALASIAFWATSASAFKLSLRYIDFLSLVFYSTTFSALVLVALCFFQGKFNQFKTWTARDYLRSLVLGGLNPVLYYLILFRAYELLPAQEAQVLNFIWPIVLVLMGVAFLGQRLNLIGSIAMLISFLGVATVASHGDLASLKFSNSLGVGLALISTVIWATYWVINQADSKDPLLRLLMNFISGVAWMSLVMTTANRWAAPQMPALIGAFYIGLFEMSLAFYCWFQALRLSENISFVGNLIFLTPFLSLMVISLVLDEAIRPATLIGLILISASILLHRLFKRY